jgi:hypothetical protein
MWDWEPWSGDLSSIPPTNDDEGIFMSYGEYIEDYTAMTREERKQLRMKSRFTETGYPGERYRPCYEDMEKKMRFTELIDGMSITNPCVFASS